MKPNKLGTARTIAVWGLVLGACLAPGMAMAQPASGGPRTALWPLKADQVTEDAAYQVTVALRKELEAMLGPRAATQDEVEAARGKPGVAAAQGCMEELRCAETVANA